MSISDDNTSYPPADWYSGLFANPYPPDVGDTYTDPRFGALETADSVIRRLTDCVADGKNGWACEYSSNDLFNCDSTYVRVTEAETGEERVLNVSDGSLVRTITGSSGPSDYWWDKEDPDIIYAVDFSAHLLKKQSMSTGVVTTVHNFTQYSTVGGAGESNIAKDPVTGDYYIALEAPSDSISFVYGFTEDEVVSELDQTTIPGFFDATLDATGDYIKVADFSVNSGLWRIYDTNKADWTSGNPATATPREGPSENAARYVFNASHPDGNYTGAGHNDVMLGPDGVSYMIAVESNFTNHIYAFDLDAGTRTKIFDLGFWLQGGVGIHICTNSADSTTGASDGWCYGSVYADTADVNPDQNWRSFMGEIIRWKYDGSSYERLAHHRSDTSTADLNANYYFAPKVSVAPSGDILAFSSNFRYLDLNSTPERYTDVYTIAIGQAAVETASANLEGGGSLAIEAHKIGRSSAAMTGHGFMSSEGAPPVPNAGKQSTPSSMGKTGAVH